MTCVAGLAHEGAVWVGGDSAGVDGLDLTVRADAKVWAADPFVFGFTTSFRMGQLLRYRLDPPRHDDRVDTMEYLVGPFVDAVRACLKDGGVAKSEGDVESGGTFLLGYAGRLFVIDSDYQVGEPADGFAAVGCGAPYAVGALAATPDAKPRRRIRTALEVAERNSAGVRGPFTIAALR